MARAADRRGSTDDENGDTLTWLTLDAIKEVLNLREYSVADLAMRFAPVADEEVGTIAYRAITSFQA